MNIGFFTVKRRVPEHYVLAEILIRSIRQIMPGVPITQFTDETSPAVPGVDHVRRKPNGPMLGMRLDHYSECEGDWLLLDTDTVICHDVRHVFEDPDFDIVVAERRVLWPEIPINTGVVFSRCPRFWKEAAQRWYALDPSQRDWLSEQRVVCGLIAESRYNVKVLPPAYNYPPEPNETPPLSTMILHYKGPRKSMLLDQHIASKSIPNPLRVFIGYDSRQPLAFHVAAHSVLARATRPIAIAPLRLSQLPITRRGLTEFTYSRFLVPYLSDYTGLSLFLDSDTLCLADILELFQYALQHPASVHVIQGQLRFEWPSVMLFDNAQCRTLTPEYVDSNINLFDLSWAGSIGSLPTAWNHLVGYDEWNPTAKLVHFTRGIPCWPETDGCEYSDEWKAERDAMLHTVSWQELLGNSVHAAGLSLKST